MKKRLISLAMAVLFCLQLLPVEALAAADPAANLCEHHTAHDTAVCGYVEGVEDAPCTFVCPVCAAVPEGHAEGTTVYFKNDGGWAEVCVHAWADGFGSTVWPGLEMTHVEDDIYSYTIPAEYNMVIFNNKNSGIQTPDLHLPTDEQNTYVCSLAKWMTLEDAKNGALAPADTYIVAGVSELCGSSWDASDPGNQMTKNGDVYIKVFSNVPVMDDYQLKVVKNGTTWLGDQTGNNIRFNVEAVCDVTVTYDPATGKITVSGDGVTIDTQLQIDGVYAVGNGAGNWLNGINWNPAAEPNRMTQISENVYEITFTGVPSGAYSIKFAANGSWADSWGGSFASSGTVSEAVYNGNDITFTVEIDDTAVTARLDLSAFDNATKSGATFTLTMVEPHSHSWSGDWTADATHHWHQCTAEGCDGTKNSYGEHSYVNDCDTDCNICGAAREITHQYVDGFCILCHHVETPAVDSDGDGYVEIDTAGKLWWFTHEVNNGNRSLNAELTADIDLAGTCGADIGNWLPIGNNYRGHFNGQGHTISNLYMAGNEMYVGLFGYVKDATIENVTVTGSIDSTAQYDESYNLAASGGVVAYLDGGTIRNCHVNVAITDGYVIGGICGYVAEGLVENCTVRGMLHGADAYTIGGIAGQVWFGTVRGCTNEASIGNVNENAHYIGGISGLSDGGIENCTNFGNIQTAGGYGLAGGIVGNQSWNSSVRNCGNHGALSGYNTGGIVADNCGIIENCYNVGSVSGTSEYVTPIASSRDGGTATNNYYLSDTTTEDGGRTAEQFASGQVAYELNGSTTTEESVWRQTLGTDAYPVLSGEKVYYGTPYQCDGILLAPTYSNAPISESVPPHTYDANGLCSACATQAIASVNVEGVVIFYTDFAEALKKSEEGSEASPAVITLLTDITVDQPVSRTGGTQILDLNGRKLTFTATSGTPFTLIKGTFTIRDSSAAKTGTMYHGVSGNQERTVIALTDSAALVLESGTLDFSRVTAAIAVEGGSLMQQRGGLITTPILLNNGRYELDGGTIETTYRYAFIIDSDGSAEYHIEITGGTVSVNDTLGIGGLLHFPQAGCDRETVTITGGIFKNVANKPFRICVYDDYANVTVTGGTFEQGLVYTNEWALDESFDVSDFPAPGYAYYDADGNLVVLAEGQTEITEKVTVGACTHIDSNTDHICEACGEILSQCADENSDHNCDVCGEILSQCTGGTATCLDKAVCDICGEPYGASNPTNHTGTDDKLVSDNAGKHNVVWFCCRAVVTENVVCTPLSPDADCTTEEVCACGYVFTGNAEHTLAIKSDKDDDYHLLECINDGCDHEEDGLHLFNTVLDDQFLVSDATCTSGKTYYRSCNCGHVSDQTFAVGDPDPNNHDGSDDFIITNGNGSHNIVWSCCNAVVSKDVVCTPVDPDADCTTEEVCSCGYVFTGNAEHTLAIKSDKDDDYHLLECINDGCDHEEDGLHLFNTVLDDQFLLSDATCTSSKTYYKSCACGHVGGETFVVGAPDPEMHTGTNDKLVSDNAGRHNVVWTCCNAVASKNVACTPVDADDTCLTAETCICGYVIKAAAAEHDFSGDYLSDTEGHWHKCKNCSVTDEKKGHSATDDGSCLTAALCSCGTVVIEAKDKHSFDNACDTDCNNPGCAHTRITYHEPLPDDGDCKTPVCCAICQAITTEAKEDHSFDNTCDTTCNNKDCKYTRTITHTPNEDDGDCETAIHCKICDAITTPAKIHSYTNACDTTCNNDGCKHTRVTYHESLPDDGNCTTPVRCAICQEITTEAKEDHSFDNTCDTTCNNKDCKHTRTITHTPNEDDGDCETAIHCKVCDAITTPATSHSFTNACDTSCNNTGCTHTRTIEHTPEDDDGDCTTDILCSVCDAVTTKGNASHTGGTATCTAKAECTVCATKYGEMLQHSFSVPQSDDADHWNKCKDCDAIETKIKHSGDDDGDCTTEVKCSCGWVLIVAKAHSFDNACDTDCNNPGCEHTRITSHKPAEDDGNCLTEIRCIICNAITTEARDAHTGGTATCTAKAKCEVCDTEYGEMLEHTFTVLQSDDADHWYKCKDCDAIETKIKHSGDDDGDCTTAVECTCGYVLVKASAGHTGGTATCTAKAKCEVCDTEYGELDSTNHAYSTSWTQTDDEHYYECPRCHEKKDRSAHVYADACDTACNTCGYVRTITHDYAEQFDDSEHWQECSVCHGKKDAAAHSFDNACDTTCSGCSFTRTITHVYAQAHGDTHHWQECSVCHDQKDIAAHSYDDDLDSTCNGCSFTRTVSYTITQGNGQTVIKGNTADFISNAPFDKFLEIRLDGTTVDSSNYTVGSGSTRVTLKAEYIETLATGEHTLIVVSHDGSASGTFTVKNKPQPVTPTTGDRGLPGLWLALTVASAFGVGILLPKPKKRKYQR